MILFSIRIHKDIKFSAVSGVSGVSNKVNRKSSLGAAACSKSGTGNPVNRSEMMFRLLVCASRAV